ncbi:MAG: Crp/Fnr family transcriptional regulator [Chitinophagaceae bacterium]|nr:Crp/Fnr family transcriptional regulator [Chitinophagaceae bacterium]
MNVPIKYCTSALSPELNDHYLEYSRLRSFRRHTLLLRADEVCRNIYFVESGMLRCFHYKGGKEITSWFAQRGDFCWSAESFLRQQPATEYIEVLEDAVVCYLSYTGLQCICLDFPLFGMLERTVTQQNLFLCQQKMQAMWMQQSPGKLSWFIQQFPGLPGKVPGKYIASYLGITEVMLSRILHA